MTNTLDKLTRIGKLIVCLAIATLVVWRGNTYNDPHSVSAVPQLMCATFAITISFTGLALANGKS